MPIRYTRVGWQDAPSTETPIDAANLNHMDNGILAISQELDTELDTIRDEFDALEQDTSSQIDSFKEETSSQISKFSSDITTMQNGLPGMISDKMDAKYGQEIGDNVTSWLTEHVDPAGSAVAVDDTLTIQGAAADAKKAGDEITSLKEDISETDSVLTLGDQVAIPFSKENNGYYIRFSTGALTASSAYCTTNYIDVTMYKSLLYKRFGVTSSTAPTIGMSFYDANKEYVSGERALYNQSAAGYQDSQISIPENAVYARFSIIKDTETYGEFAVSGSSIIRNTLDAYKGDIDENSAILAFDDSISLDAPITDVGKFVKFNTGVLAPSTPYCATDFVNISKYAYILYKRITSTETAPTHGMAFYDINKVYISGMRSGPTTSAFGYRFYQIEVPTNAVYARFTTIKDTETYGDFEVSGKSKIFEDIKPYNSPYQKNIVFGSYSSDWYEGQGDSYSGFTIDTLYSEMITAWDALVANSKGYVTKEEIGMASDNQTMYCYKLIPTRYRNNTGTSVTNNPPTFLIVASLHGFEKSAAFGAYYLARDLVYNFNKNSVLNSLRTRCAIYVVPVGNPWGFDNKERKNYNGIDLNRNWGEDPSGETDPSSAYYPGAEPFDQPETQAIKGLIDSNLNLFYVVDYHTNGQYKVASWADVNWLTYGYSSVYGDNYSRLVYVASQNHISDITENLQMEYSLDTNGESIGSITIGAQGAPRPTITSYTRIELNIMGGTFEGNNGLPSESGSYSEMSQKINSELIGNWIKNLLLVYKDASLK